MTASPIVRLLSMSAAGVAFVGVLTVTPAAQSAVQKATSPVTVLPAPIAQLQPLLPAMPGWTKGPVRGDRAVLSETCSYNFAYALYTKGTATIRVTLADTGFDPGGLGALATMVTTFPDGYSGTIPPATTITRLMFKDSPAASLWDTKTSEGEFTVVVHGRFVAKAEGTNLEDQDLLRATVDLIDLKALAALK